MGQEAIDEPETFSRAHVRQIQATGLFLMATSLLIGASKPVRIQDNKAEWDGTDIVFEIARKGANTEPHFTHVSDVAINGLPVRAYFSRPLDSRPPVDRAIDPQCDLSVHGLRAFLIPKPSRFAKAWL